MNPGEELPSPPPPSTAEGVPSKVIHFRNISPDITQSDLVSIASPFGAVAQVVMLRSKNQALLQMQDISAAMGFIQYYSTMQGVSIRGRNVYVQFSSHQELTGNGVFRSTTRESEAPPNKILLVTIHNPVYPITVDVLHQVFGPVEKIVIFSKSAGLQALVQYPDVDSAIQARNALQFQNIYAGSCTLHIQFSNLEELTIHHNTEKTHDFLNPNLPTEPPQRDGNVVMSGSGVANVGAVSGVSGFQSFGMDPQFQQILGQQYMMGGQSGAGSDKSVLLVSNLNPQKITCDMLFNLFSNYGNIIRIKILHSKPDHSLIQMSDNVQSTTAMNYLKGLILFGKAMEINYSKHSYIANVSDQGDGADFNSKDFSNSPLNRFIRVDSKNYKHICAPSNLLHLSNLSPTVTSQSITEHFEPFGKIAGMKFFETNGKRQCLVQFYTVQAAAEALCSLHNSPIEGQRIRVSFSKNTL